MSSHGNHCGSPWSSMDTARKSAGARIETGAHGDHCGSPPPIMGGRGRPLKRLTNPARHAATIGDSQW